MDLLVQTAFLEIVVIVAIQGLKETLVRRETMVHKVPMVCKFLQ